MLLNNFSRPRMEGDAGDGGGSGGGAGTSVLGGGGSPSPAPTPVTPDWASTLPDELKSAPSLSNYKDLPSFVKSALEAEKLIGKKGIIKPGENASPDEWGKFYNELGRPEKADGYGFKKPEDWPADIPFSEAMVPKVQELFHKHGVPADMAQKLWAGYHEMIKSEFSSHVQLSEQQVNEGLNKLKTEWGGEEKYNANIETAKMAVKQYGGDELINFLNESGLGNHPALIKAFAEAGKNLRDDTFHGGNNNVPGHMTPERAKSEIDRLQNDKEFTKVLYSRDLVDRSAQKEAAARLERLYEIAYPTFTTKG